MQLEVKFVLARSLQPIAEELAKRICGSKQDAQSQE